LAFADITGTDPRLIASTGKQHTAHATDLQK